jgi:hypothetical protein
MATSVERVLSVNPVLCGGSTTAVALPRMPCGNHPPPAGSPHAGSISTGTTRRIGTHTGPVMAVDVYAVDDATRAGHHSVPRMPGSGRCYIM